MTHKCAFAFVLSGLTGWPGAAEVVDTPRQYVIPKTDKAITIDGKPIDPRVIDYSDYHGKLIGAVGDSDDSANARKHPAKPLEMPKEFQEWERP